MKKRNAPASRRKASRQTTGSSPTILRAYRFNTILFEQFERDCLRHLRNPRAVLEALIMHWLKANSVQRDVIAEQYQKVERSLNKTEK